jgi:hypothetical protein
VLLSLLSAAFVVGCGNSDDSAANVSLAAEVPVTTALAPTTSPPTTPPAATTTTSPATTVTTAAPATTATTVPPVTTPAPTTIAPSLQLSVGEAAEATIGGASDTWAMTVEAVTIGPDAACGGLRSFQTAIADEGFEIWAIDVSLVNNAAVTSIGQAPRLDVSVATPESVEVQFADPCRSFLSFGLSGTSTSDRVVVAAPTGVEQLSLTWSTGRAAGWDGRSATWSLPRQ